MTEAEMLAFEERDYLRRLKLAMFYENKIEAAAQKYFFWLGADAYD
jgi:hypothetical protein